MSLPPITDVPAALAAADAKNSAETERQPDAPMNNDPAGEATTTSSEAKSPKRGVRGPRTLRCVRASCADDNRKAAKQVLTEPAPDGGADGASKAGSEAEVVAGKELEA